MQTFIIAMIMIYLILVGLFKSFIQPVVILLTVPLALVLVFPGLLLTNNPLSFFSGIGIIALTGVVVNDAIVLLDAINQYRQRGLSKHEAIVAGVKQRVKPILSTSITTIGGVLPLSIANPFMGPLGFALSFGLVSSTICTLYVIPIIYGLLTRDKEK